MVEKEAKRKGGRRRRGIDGEWERRGRSGGGEKGVLGGKRGKDKGGRRDFCSTKNFQYTNWFSVVIFFFFIKKKKKK